MQTTHFFFVFWRRDLERFSEAIAAAVRQVDHLEDVVEVACEHVHRGVVVGGGHAAKVGLLVRSDYEQTVLGVGRLLAMLHVHAAQVGSLYVRQRDLFQLLLQPIRVVDGDRLRVQLPIVRYKLKIATCIYI